MYRVARAATTKDGQADKEREGRREIRAAYNSSGHLMIQLVRFPSAPALFVCQRRLVFYVLPFPLSLRLSLFLKRRRAARITNAERARNPEERYLFAIAKRALSR